MHDPSQPLDNSRHEAFCRAVVSGKSDMAAYVEAGYRGAEPEKRAYEIRRNPGVEERIKWMKEQAASDTVLSTKEKREFLARVVRTPIGMIDEKSDLCQSYRLTETGPEYKTVCKIAAIKTDNDLAGEGSEAEGNLAIADIGQALTSLMHERAAS